VNLTVRLFATLKERVGAPCLNISLPETATVADLLVALIAAHPALENSLDTLIVAVNQEFADLTQSLSPTDDVVLFPPVSGG